MAKGKSRIQVPYSMLLNPDVPHNAIYLYVIIRNSCTDNNLKIYTEKLKSEKYLNWKSTETLTKYLKYLKEHNYIDYNFIKLPKHKPLELIILPIPKEENYTEISRKAISMIKEKAQNIEFITKKKNKSITTYRYCVEIAMRLYYFYVKNYNFNEECAFPSYLGITKDTGISSIYIKAINTMFHKNKIVDVKIGEFKDILKQETGDIKFMRERNTYIPLL